MFKKGALFPDYGMSLTKTQLERDNPHGNAGSFHMHAL